MLVTLSPKVTSWIDVIPANQSKTYAQFNVTMVRLVQTAKALLLMLVYTFDKMVTLVRLSHLKKAYSPMLVVLDGMVTLVRPLQFSKALSPMLVTPSGMVTLVRPVQSENALLPMLVTLEGIVVFLQPDINSLVAVLIIALQFSRESYTVLPL